jgi:hypothetical protein
VPSLVVTHIEDALKVLDDFNEPVEVYVTGSLHLVGGVLSFIHPDCFGKTLAELKAELDVVKEYKEYSRIEQNLPKQIESYD